MKIQYRTLSGLMLASMMSIACAKQDANQQNLNQQASNQSSSTQTTSTAQSNGVQQFSSQNIAKFNEPWAITVMPDGKFLITERAGKLKIFDPQTKSSVQVSGVPNVYYSGQGGLGDVVLHPDFAQNRWIYLSYAAKEKNGAGAEVIRATLNLDQPSAPRLTDLKKIWQQVPKISGDGHYAHRLKFDQDKKLWISSGERQHFTPAQDMQSNLGKILRLNADGTIPTDNPFYQRGGVAAQIWSLGHRNPLGMDFDQSGQLWVVEMGPQGGDELNKIEKAANYGYPIVSDGDHYDGKKIPDHATRPEFKAPDVVWTPVISPSSLMIYKGNLFPYWQNKAIIGGLSSESIVVVDLTAPAKEVQRIDMKERIRAITQTPDGSIWVLQDGKNANLIQLNPKK